MQSQLEQLEGRQLLAWDFAGALELGSGRFVDHTVVIKDVATDGAGHVLVAGEFKGTIDFDVRRNHALVLESQGTHFFDRVPDGFVAKYTAGGRLLWARQLQITGESYSGPAAIGRLAVDGEDNVVLTGTFTGRVDFDPGPRRNFVDCEHLNDAFAWKLDPTGRALWARQLDDIPPLAYAGSGKAVAIDADGDVVVTGEYSPAPQGSPDRGGFVARLDGATGATAYNNALPAGAVVGNAVSADGKGYAYVAGRQVVGGESRQAYVAKVNRRGNLVWYTALGGATRDVDGQGLAVSTQGDVYVSGAFAGTGVFGSSVANAAGDQDAYLARLDGAGAVAWVRTWGGSDTAFEDSADDVALDGNGNVLVAGRFVGPVDFDPGTGQAVLNAGGTADAYVARFDSAGTFVAVRRVGGNAGRPYPPVAVAWSRGTGTFLAGTFNGPMDLNPGPETSFVPGRADASGFIVRLLDDAA